MPVIKTRLEECIELKDYINIKLQKYLDADAESVNDYTASIMEEHDTLFGSNFSVRPPTTQQDTSRSKFSDITGSILIGNTPRSKGDRIKALKDSMKESNKESNGYRSIMSKKPLSSMKTVSTLTLHKGNQLNSQRFEADLSGKSQNTCQSIPEESLSIKSQITWQSMPSGRNFPSPSSYMKKMEEMSLNSEDCKGTLSKSEHSIVMYK
jgi:hypothetical protein